MTQTIFFLRHAESIPSPDVDEPDWPLSADGRRQARELVPVLQKRTIDVVYSSPYRRAVETVEPYAHASGIRIRQRDDLRERLLADRFLDDPQTAARQTWDDFSWSTPTGETNHQAQKRFVRCVNEIRDEHHGSNILISSHGTVIALYLNAVDPSVGVDIWRALSFPDLVRVELPQKRWSRVKLAV